MNNLNSVSMKTVVETYIIEETQELIYDSERIEKYQQLCDELGLTGQATIQVKDKSPIPYLFMNTSLVNVFTTLCPMKVDISKYNKTPIPVEILELVALSKRENHFDEFQIWYNDADPDPVCVGVRKNSAFDRSYPTWDRGLDKWLIGRWADVKASLATLTEKARIIYCTTQKLVYEKNIRDAQRSIEDIQNEANARFGVNANLGPDYLPF
jgi:hypothetical protein